MQSINGEERRRSSGESAKRARWEALEEFTRHRIQGFRICWRKRSPSGSAGASRSAGRR
jgi:hypothetical protein